MYPVSKAFFTSGAGEHPEVLLDWEDYHKSRYGIYL